MTTRSASAAPTQPSSDAKAKDIKIHLGFMPEEVASVLKPIINGRMAMDAAAQTKESESVIIISRGNIKDELFEQFVSNFGISTYDEISSTTTAKPDSSGLCDRIATAMGSFLDGVDIQATLIPGAKTKMAEHMVQGRPNISVGRIGTGPVTRICIQLPEMGFQSDLAAAYTLSMLDAIAKHALDPEVPITISSYGAGGSAHEDLQPGQMNNCEAVLNLRTHIDLTPQIDHLIEQIKSKPNCKEELDKLMEMKKGIEQHLTGFNQNQTLISLSNIRNSLIAKGLPAADLKLPKDHKPKFYSEIAIARPAGGKTVYYRTASYADREVAEEAAHLMLLRFGEIETPDLTIGYTNFLKRTNKEYKELSDKVAASNKGPQLQKEMAACVAELRNNSENLMRVDQEIQSLLTKITDDNVSMRTSLKGVQSEKKVDPKELDVLKENLQKLQAERKNLLDRRQELEDKQTKIMQEASTLKVDEKASEAIEKFHQNEIKKLQELGEKGLFALPGASQIAFHTYTSSDRPAAGDMHENLADKTLPERTADYLRTELHNDKEKGFSYNFAASMFVGTQTKEAVYNIGKGEAIIADVNMEDDIVADAIHMVVDHQIGIKDTQGIGIQQFAMARVHCDPFHIDHSVEEEFKQWCKNKVCSEDYYIDAIMWGLKGFSPAALTASAKWDFAGGIKERAAEFKAKGIDVDTLFFEHNGCIVDPFWREIGTDFLADAMNGKAIPFSDKEKKDPQIEAFINETKKKAAAIKKLAQEGNPEKEPELRRLIAALVKDVLSKMDMINKENDSYRVWARTYSWGGNPQANVEKISFSGSSIDRAFYVSSNMNSLIGRGEEIIKQKTPTQQVKSDMVVLYHGPEDQAKPVASHYDIERQRQKEHIKSKRAKQATDATPAATSTAQSPSIPAAPSSAGQKPAASSKHEKGHPAVIKHATVSPHFELKVKQHEEKVETQKTPEVGAPSKPKQK